MAQFTISLDFELGWGSIENGVWKRREKAGVYRDLRTVLPLFLKALDDHEIALTWATVGAMVDPPSSDDFDHLPAHIRTLTQGFAENAAPETKDGRDLFDIVCRSRTAQDIGSHTFAHCRWSLPGYGAEAKQIEMSRAASALNKFGVRPIAFVYPLNHVSDLEVLHETGFAIARTAPPRPASRVGKLFEMALGRSPASRRSVGPGGLTCETGSLLYVWGINSDWRLRRAMILRQVNRGLSRAAQGDADFHIWLHPFNLVETPGLLEDVLSLITKVTRMRDKGMIDVATMTERARIT